MTTIEDIIEIIDNYIGPEIALDLGVATSIETLTLPRTMLGCVSKGSDFAQIFNAVKPSVKVLSLGGILSYRKYVQALVEYGKALPSSIKTVQLCSFNLAHITNSDMQYLIGTMLPRKTKALHIKYCYIFSLPANVIINLLQRLPRLEELSLERVDMLGPQTRPHLNEIAAHIPRVKKLSFANNNLGQNPSGLTSAQMIAFLKAIPDSVEEFDFSQNDLGQYSEAELTEIFAAFSKKIKRLNISGNSISWLKLSMAMSSLTAVEELTLDLEADYLINDIYELLPPNIIKLNVQQLYKRTKDVNGLYFNFNPNQLVRFDAQYSMHAAHKSSGFFSQISGRMTKVLPMDVVRKSLLPFLNGQDVSRLEQVCTSKLSTTDKLHLDTEVSKFVRSSYAKKLNELSCESLLDQKRYYDIFLDLCLPPIELVEDFIQQLIVQFNNAAPALKYKIEMHVKDIFENKRYDFSNFYLDCKLEEILDEVIGQKESLIDAPLLSLSLEEEEEEVVELNFKRYKSLTHHH